MARRSPRAKRRGQSIPAMPLTSCVPGRLAIARGTNF
jgi:hypothetical protein